MRYDTEPRVQTVGPVNDDRNIEFLTLGVERIPVRFVHPGARTAPLWIGADIGCTEAEIADATLEFVQAMRSVRRVGKLGQLAGTNKAIREKGALLVDHVVHVACSGRNQMGLHPSKHQKWSRSDQLNVNLSLVDVGDMPLDCASVLLLGDTRERRVGDALGCGFEWAGKRCV